MTEIWKPHVVVAAVIEHGGRFLMIEEETLDGIRLNQPAGHLEPSESIIAAVRREVLEETARDFEPDALIAIYRLPAAGHRPDFIRFTFCGQVGEPHPERALDTGILRTEWMDLEQIRDNTHRHRSPLVAASIDTYLAGHRYPLDILHDYIP
jgi:8-oxo-dGTP pyrophosphatase MutT (NUDIX family)